MSKSVNDWLTLIQMWSYRGTYPVDIPFEYHLFEAYRLLLRQQKLIKEMNKNHLRQRRYLEL
jgi:cobalamin-dependent methionine synthase I